MFTYLLCCILTADFAAPSTKLDKVSDLPLNGDTRVSVVNTSSTSTKPRLSREQRAAENELRRTLAEYDDADIGDLDPDCPETQGWFC